jgi:GTP cyclohydrolase I
MAAKPFAQLHDTQSQADTRNIPIDRVGVRGLRYPIQVLDKKNKTQSTVAMITLTADLPHQYKGTHMSRFIEVLADHGPVLHVGNIRQLLDSLRNRLDAETAHGEFEFPFFVAKKAPVTGAAGLMDYTVRFQATLVGGKMDFVLTVIVPVTTLCPCSKAISESGAHNQRGHVTCSIRSKTPIWIEDLVRLVESCASSELFSLLKRPDEKAVTERAYGNPVFVEDLVRDVAARLAAEPEITWYQVEAENFESIHNHNAYAFITGPERHAPVHRT